VTDCTGKNCEIFRFIIYRIHNTEYQAHIISFPINIQFNIILFVRFRHSSNNLKEEKEADFQKGNKRNSVFNNFIIYFRKLKFTKKYFLLLISFWAKICPF